MDGGAVQGQPGDLRVDAIRPVLLGSEAAAAGLAVPVLGHTMTVGEEVMIVGGLGAMLLSAAVWRFIRSK